MKHPLRLSIVSESALTRCVKVNESLEFTESSLNAPILNLSSLEHTEDGIESFIKKFPNEVYLVPAVKDGFLFINKGTFQWISNETILTIEDKKFFIGRLSGGSVLNRLEEARYGIFGAILWNDLPFGLTQCALEIDALELSRKQELPLVWISTHWINKKEEELNRRGFWISSALGEMVKSEFQSIYTLEPYELNKLMDVSFLESDLSEDTNADFTAGLATGTSYPNDLVFDHLDEII